MSACRDEARTDDIPIARPVEIGAPQLSLLLIGSIGKAGKKNGAARRKKHNINILRLENVGWDCGYPGSHQVGQIKGLKTKFARERPKGRPPARPFHRPYKKFTPGDLPRASQASH